VRGSPWHAYRVEPLSIERGPEAHLDSVKLTMPTQAILDGRQPRDLTPEKLLEHSRLPLAWHDQRIVLGFG